MVGESDEERTSPLLWPAQWMRDEKFWRDVATRTAAILISGLVLYDGALLLGYVTAPGQRSVVRTAVLIVGGVATGMVSVTSNPEGGRRRLIVAVIIVAATVTIVSLMA